MVVGLGSWELLFVGLALLVLFGPEHAPGVFRKAGNLQARVQRTLEQLEHAVEEEKRRETDETETVPASRDALPSSDEDESA